MNTTPKASKNDVLHAFSAESNPNADTLASYLKRYPQYRDALIDLSIELNTTPKFDEVAAEKAPSDKSRQAWSKFQSMLSPTDPASAAPRSMDNPLSNLSDERFRELASELNVKPPVLIPLTRLFYPGNHYSPAILVCTCTDIECAS